MGRPRRDPLEDGVSDRTVRRRRQEQRTGKAAESDKPLEVLHVNRERPPMPPGLPARAKTVWRQLLSDLEGNGILARSDSASIEGAARAIGRARECSSRASAERDSKLAQAWIRLELQAWNTARAYCDQLGLSARARQQLGFSVTRPQGKVPPAAAASEEEAGAAPAAPGAAPLPGLSVIAGGAQG